MRPYGNATRDTPSMEYREDRGMVELFFLSQRFSRFGNKDRTELRNG